MDKPGHYIRVDEDAGANNATHHQHGGVKEPEPARQRLAGVRSGLRDSSVQIVSAQRAQVLADGKRTPMRSPSSAFWFLQFAPADVVPGIRTETRLPSRHW